MNSDSYFTRVPRTESSARGFVVGGAQSCGEPWHHSHLAFGQRTPLAANLHVFDKMNLRAPFSTLVVVCIPRFRRQFSNCRATANTEKGVWVGATRLVRSNKRGEAVHLRGTTRRLRSAELQRSFQALARQLCPVYLEKDPPITQTYACSAKDMANI